jgi:hypothetical protein
VWSKSSAILVDNINRIANTVKQLNHSIAVEAHLVTHVSVQVSIYNCSSTKAAAAAVAAG